MGERPFHPLEHFQVYPLLDLHLGPVDLSITNVVVWMWFGMLTMVLLLWFAFRNPRIIPGHGQMLAEILYDFVASLTIKNIHGHGEAYVPAMFSLFCFILGSNLIGLLPGGFTPTSQLVVTGTLAVMVFAYTILLRIRLHGWGFFHAFAPPGVPKLILPLMIPIEVLSFMARPVTLALRLFANMTAGHTALAVLAFLGLSAPWFMQWLPLGFTVVQIALESVIALIQAYIFTILSCVYIDDALSGH